MKDPKVAELVKQFTDDVAALNKTWAALNNNNVYVRVYIKGNGSYGSPKSLEASEITQCVDYLKDVGE
tara:strand:- start:12 stop:215 length:204 start_codon:yes stop_codon:yes gene_type:complete